MTLERSLWRRSLRTVTAVVVVVLLVASMPGTALAETRAGGSVVVEADETVAGDLDAFAGSVAIHGTVEGDLRAVGGTVRIDGTVTGDVSATAGSVVVGPDARIEGDLEVAAGDVLIAGTVETDVQVGAETIRVSETAVIGGNLEYSGTLERASGASIAGTVSAESGLGFDSQFGFSIPGWIVGAYGFMVGLLGAVILLGLFPDFSASVAAAATDEPLRTGVIGLLALIGVPIGLVVLALTIVGIPLALIGLFVYVLSLWVGSVYGRYAVGTALLTQLETDNRWLALLTGFLAVAVLVRVPLVGGLIQLLVVLAGLGGLAVTLGRRYRKPRSGATSEPQPGDDTEGSGV